ncbi:glutathione synthase [Gonapodya sp. JEL0774]|nr:glutathione synthase [Gonapodya sp. JEL0774]
MSIFDNRVPTGIPHAGTYNNNTLLMTVGLAGLTEAYTREKCVALNEYGDRLRERLNAAARKVGAPLLFTGMGSMIGTHFTDKTVIRRLADLKSSSLPLRELFFFDLNAAGIWASRGGTMNLSLPFLDHGEHDADRLVRVVEDWLEKRRAVWEEFGKVMRGAESRI